MLRKEKNNNKQTKTTIKNNNNKKENSGIERKAWTSDKKYEKGWQGVPLGVIV